MEKKLGKGGFGQVFIGKRVFPSKQREGHNANRVRDSGGGAHCLPATLTAMVASALAALLVATLSTGFMRTSCAATMAADVAWNQARISEIGLILLAAFVPLGST